MRNLFTLLLIGLMSGGLFAQQLPLFSQYYFNSFIYNPSLTGQDFGTSATVVGRKQFTGLSSSLGTYGATFQTRSQEKRAGFGLYVYSDDLNLFQTNSAVGSYAYHVPLSDQKTLSFGLGLGFVDSRYNAANFFLVDEYDPVITLLSNGGSMAVDANIGVNLQLKNFHFGLANLQMFKSQEAFKGTTGQETNFTLANHWMTSLGFTTEINDKWTFEPLILVRKTPNVPGQTDINFFFNRKDKGFIGLAYRDGMSFSSMIGLNLTPNMMAGYAYDITTHKLRSALGNTHEVMLKFDFNKPNQAAITSEKAKEYEDKIEGLQNEVAYLKTENRTTKQDTVYLERVVEKIVEKPVYIKPKDPITKPVVKDPVTKPVVKDPVVKEKPTNTNPPKPTVTKSPTGAGYYVIAGSFATKEAAQKFQTSLASKGYRSYIKYDENSKRHYVHMGKYTNKDLAVNYVRAMKTSGLPLWVKTYTE